MEGTGNTLLFWIGLLASGSIVLFAISRSSRRGLEPQDPYRTALDHLVLGEPEAALESLRRVIQSGKAPADAYIQLGNLLRRRGDVVAAFQIHRNLTVRQDLSLEERIANMRSLVEDHRALGQRHEALRGLESLVELRRDPEVLLDLARESLQVGQTAQAVAYLREAARKSPRLGRDDLAAFLTSAADRCMQADDRSDARDLLQQALKENDTCPQALYAMGSLSMLDGDTESALYYWQKLAISGESEGFDVHERLEKVYFDMGRFGEIERVYAQILEKRPHDVQTLLAAARIALKKGETDEAEDLLRHALEVSPQHGAAFQMLSGLYLESGRQRELRQLLGDHMTQHREGRDFSCPECGQRAGGRTGYCVGCGRFGPYVRS